MKKYSLVLLTIFIIWLFLQSYLFYEIQRAKIQSHNLASSHFKIHYFDKLGMVFIVDLRYGNTFRYYQNYDKNNQSIISEGWTPIKYSTECGMSSTFYPIPQNCEAYLKNIEEQKNK